MTARRGIGPNIVTVLALIGVLGALVFLMGTVDRQDRELAAVSANSDALYSQVEDLGEHPVAPPAAAVVESAPSSGAKGDRGLPGPSASTQDIAASVSAYCAIRVNCSGTVGPIAPAIIPRDGIDGKSGTDGADSTVPGQKGDAGADSQVPGPTGTGVASIVCQDDGYWLFTLTQPDGTTTTQTVAGPCRVDPITTPPTQGVTP